MTGRLLASLALLALTAPVADAQRTDGVRLAIQPASRVWVSGTSTLHDFTCKSDGFSAEVTVDRAATQPPAPAVERPLLATEVVLPVKSLKCGKDKMDSNMYKTLRADEFPRIAYALTKSEVVAGSTTSDSLTLRAVGTLTVVGQAKPITMDVRLRRRPEGGFSGRGTVDLLLTDLGIKPPSFMMGSLRVGNRITIGFDVIAASPSTVASSTVERSTVERSTVERAR